MNKINNILVYWLGFVLLLLVAMSFLFFYYPEEKNKESALNVLPAKEVTNDFLAPFKDLKRCGNWPFNNVDLNPSRGNPFSKKESAINPMTASSSAECLSVDLIY